MDVRVQILESGTPTYTGNGAIIKEETRYTKKFFLETDILINSNLPVHIQDKEGNRYEAIVDFVRIQDGRKYRCLHKIQSIKPALQKM